jgi:hypothetical protein
MKKKKFCFECFALEKKIEAGVERDGRLNGRAAVRSEIRCLLLLLLSTAARGSIVACISIRRAGLTTEIAAVEYTI